MMYVSLLTHASYRRFLYVRHTATQTDEGNNMSQGGFSEPPSTFLRLLTAVLQPRGERCTLHESLRLFGVISRKGSHHANPSTTLWSSLISVFPITTWLLVTPRKVVESPSPGRSSSSRSITSVERAVSG